MSLEKNVTASQYLRRDNAMNAIRSLAYTHNQQSQEQQKEQCRQSGQRSETRRSAQQRAAARSAASAGTCWTLSRRSNTCFRYSHIWWHHVWAHRKSDVWTPRGASGPRCSRSLRPWPSAAQCSDKSPTSCSWRGRRTGSVVGWRRQPG